jgi:hypothetical protein
MCSQPDLVLVLRVHRENIIDAGLCISCGATAVRTFAPDLSGGSTTYGVDWASPDEGVRLLRESGSLVTGG